MKKHILLIAVATLGLAGFTGSVLAQDDPLITTLRIVPHTKDDDKDLGDGVKVSILRDGKTVIAEWGPFGADLTYHNGESGEPGWTLTLPAPFHLSETPHLTLLVQKTGNDKKGWFATFSVHANNDKYHLIKETEKVLFGSRNPIVVERPLEGANGIKAYHLTGNSWHEFPFDK